MNTYTGRGQENKNNAVANKVVQHTGITSFMVRNDNRPEGIAQRKIQQAANTFPISNRFNAIQRLAHSVSVSTVQRKNDSDKPKTVQREGKEFANRTGVVQCLLNQDQVQATFNLNHPLNILPDPVNNIIEANSATIITWLDPADGALRRSQLQKLKSFLDFDDNNHATRFVRLLWYNNTFASRHFELKIVNAKATTAQLNLVHAAISPLAAHRLEGARSMEAAGGFKELHISAVRQPAVNDLIATSNDIHAEGDHFASFGLKDQHLQIVEAARAVYPRNGALPQLVWGRGNNNSIPANKRAHFDKHCLRLNMAANPDINEPWKWMQRLGYQITKANVEAITGVPFGMHRGRYFGVTGNIDSKDRADEFFNNWLPGHQAVQNDLYIRHGAAYENNVEAASGAMNNKYVSLEGGSVFAQGQSGDVYIVAKWWGGATRDFQISSGYLNTAKINDNRTYKLWDLT